MAHVQSITALPLLDLAQLDGSPQQRRQFLDELRLAARHIGFFYLTGHGIDRDLLAQVQQQARAFFALPEADKRAVGMLNSPTFAATTAPPRRSPEASPTCANNSTSAPSASPCPRRNTRPPGHACKAPTNGRRLCHNSNPWCSAGSRR